MQRQQLAAAFRNPTGKDVLQRTADHKADQLVARRLAWVHGADERPVLEHRDAVGDLVQLVEPMRNIKDQHILIAQPPDEREELRQVFLRKNSRGLVHDQNARFDCHGFGDFHNLTLRGSETPHAPPHVDSLKANALQNLLDLAVRGAPIDPPAQASSCRHIAEQDVLRDAEVGYQVGVLSHHADAELLAAHRVRDRLALAADPDFTRVALHRTCQNTRERALSCAVLADDGVHFAAFGAQVDRAQRLRAAEALADAPHVQKRSYARYPLISYVLSGIVSRSVKVALSRAVIPKRFTA